jgi:DNA-binding NarL/FixJ family response regulator
VEHAAVERAADLLAASPESGPPGLDGAPVAVKRLEHTIEQARASLAGLVRQANQMATGLAGSPNPALVEKLTPREWEVLTLLVQGHSTKEIARILSITFKTAAAHRAHIMAKLGVHNVASLVRVAMESAPSTPSHQVL